jgi:hypothetical protein
VAPNPVHEAAATSTDVASKPNCVGAARNEELNAVFLWEREREMEREREREREREEWRGSRNQKWIRK